MNEVLYGPIKRDEEGNNGHRRWGQRWRWIRRWVYGNASGHGWWWVLVLEICGGGRYVDGSSHTVVRTWVHLKIFRGVVVLRPTSTPNVARRGSEGSGYMYIFMFSELCWFFSFLVVLYTVRGTWTAYFHITFTLNCSVSQWSICFFSSIFLSFLFLFISFISDCSFIFFILFLFKFWNVFGTFLYWNNFYLSPSARFVINARGEICSFFFKNACWPLFIHEFFYLNIAGNAIFYFFLYMSW